MLRLEVPLHGQWSTCGDGGRRLILGFEIVAGVGLVEMPCVRQVTGPLSSECVGSSIRYSELADVSPSMESLAHTGGRGRGCVRWP